VRSGIASVARDVWNTPPCLPVSSRAPTYTCVNMCYGGNAIAAAHQQGCEQRSLFRSAADDAGALIPATAVTNRRQGTVSRCTLPTTPTSASSASPALSVSTAEAARGSAAQRVAARHAPHAAWLVHQARARLRTRAGCPCHTSQLSPRRTSRCRRQRNTVSYVAGAYHALPHRFGSGVFPTSATGWYLSVVYPLFGSAKSPRLGHIRVAAEALKRRFPSASFDQAGWHQGLAYTVCKWAAAVAIDEYEHESTQRLLKTRNRWWVVHYPCQWLWQTNTLADHNAPFANGRRFLAC
jgi:hypothetical protein